MRSFLGLGYCEIGLLIQSPRGLHKIGTRHNEIAKIAHGRLIHHRFGGLLVCVCHLVVIFTQVGSSRHWGSKHIGWIVSVELKQNWARCPEIDLEVDLGVGIALSTSLQAILTSRDHYAWAMTVVTVLMASASHSLWTTETVMAWPW